MANLVVFEQYVADHGPLARTRPVLELRCGALSLGDRLQRHYQAPAVYHEVRAPMTAVHQSVLRERQQHVRVNELVTALADDVLIVDGAILARGGSWLPELEGADELGVIRDVVDYVAADGGEWEPVYRAEERIAYLRLRKRTAAALLARCGPDLAVLLRAAHESAAISRRLLEPEQLLLMTYPWHLIAHNAATIRTDFADYGSGVAADARVDPGTVWSGHGQRLPDPGSGNQAAAVHIGSGSKVGPFVSFDVSEGPVIIGDHVVIEPHCNIKGPAFVGAGSTLWAFADIKEGCSLGPRSRVCGQVEEAIFHGYMHKFHVGFVGHSYLGEGVNLGDQTVTSNLKNDRTPVEVYLRPGMDAHINTGALYAGALIGDGVATGTNTNLTTGAVVEPLSTIVAAQATPKYISGLWTNGRHLPWPFAAAYNAFRILVSERLGRSLPPGHEALFRQVYAEMKTARRALRLRDTRRVRD